MWKGREEIPGPFKMDIMRQSLWLQMKQLNE